MEHIPTIQVLTNKFEEKFKVFDYDFYNNAISEREKNDAGVTRGSCLIKEVTVLSSFFASKKLTAELTTIEVAICAFEGWNLSTHFISKNKTMAQIYNQLKKVTKIIFKQYKKQGIKITFLEVAWLVFCSAMIREKLYSNFHHDMISLMTRGDNRNKKINVAFKLIEPKSLHQ